MDGAAHELSRRLEDAGNDEATGKSVELLYIIIHCYLSLLSPAEAIALTNEWQAAALERESAETRAAITAARDDVVESFERSVSLEDRLVSLPALHAEQALNLRDSWPRLNAVVTDLISATERGRLLEEWIANQPAWLPDVPASALCWLGELASAYNTPRAAEDYFRLALDAGAYPRAYWVARLAQQKAVSDLAAARRALEPEMEHDYLASALHAIYGEEWQVAEDRLTTWAPTRSADLVLREVLLAQLLAIRGNRNLAIARATEAWEKFKASGAALMAARLLLQRALQGESAHRLTDTQAAMELATRARNERRVWYGNSAEAVVMMVQAAQLSGDPEAAWKFTQPPPDGEALASEAEDQAVQSEAALTAALTGRLDHARDLSAGVASEFTKAQVSAILAEVTSDGSKASREVIQATWNEAWQRAGNEEEQLQAAMGIAEAGAVLPDLTTLGDSYPEAVEEIYLVSRAMSVGTENLAQLRTYVNQSRLLAVKLAERYADDGNLKLAAETLKDAAGRWSDPHLMSMAAKKFKDAGELAVAREVALESLTQGGVKWAGTADMYKLLVEVNSTEGRWDLAVQAARTLVAIDTNDHEARWALVKCLISRGEVDEAWQALTSSGQPIDPRNRDEALLWISLSARFSTDTQFVGHALDLMKSWPEDEEVLGAFIQGLYMGLRRDELEPTEKDLAALHAATNRYLEQFPQSTVFRAVPLGSADNLLAPFEEDLRAQYEHTREITRKVRAAQLPLGMLSSVVGRSYTEASIRRAAGLVFAIDFGARDAELNAIEAAKSSPVVVEPTVLHSLVLLDSSLVEVLLGTPSSVITTDPLFKDMLRARDAFALRSTLSVGWDPDRERAAVTELSDDDAEMLAQRSTDIVRLAERLARLPWPELRHLPGLPSEASAWLSGLDQAKDKGWPYWSDDAVIRSLARKIGVPSFGTGALIHALNHEERITDLEMTVAEAQLIRNFYVDFGFPEQSMKLAAASDAWRPRGVAAALTRTSTWGNPDAVVKLILTALENVATSSSDDVAGWVSAASVGLIRIVDTDDAASNNLRILMGQILMQPWLGPSQFAATMRGVRDGLGERPGVPNPLPTVLAGLYGQLVSQYDHVVAAGLLMNLASAAEVEDQALAARTVLTYKDA